MKGRLVKHSQLIEFDASNFEGLPESHADANAVESPAAVGEPAALMPLHAPPQLQPNWGSQTTGALPTQAVAAVAVEQNPRC